MENEAAAFHHEGDEENEENGAQAGAALAEEADADLNGDIDKPLALDELFKEEYKISKALEDWSQRRVGISELHIFKYVWFF